jgi:hypothetical protein
MARRIRGPTLPRRNGPDRGRLASCPFRFAVGGDRRMQLEAVRQNSRRGADPAREIVPRNPIGAGSQRKRFDFG